MPASQEIESHGGLKIYVTAVDEPEPVYYTDERPKFKIELTNDDSNYDVWAEDSKLVWDIVIDGNSTHEDALHFGPLENGDTESHIVQSNVLSHEGHGVFGISTGSVAHVDGGEKGRMNASRSRSSKPAYSFSVWDESHYDAQIRRPQKLQKGNLILSGALIFFALVQITIAALPYL